MKSGTRWMSDLVDQIVSGIKQMAPLPIAIAMSYGCQSTNSEATAPVALAQEATTAPAPVAPAESNEPKELGKFSITFYYVIGEEEVLAKAKAKAKKAANDNQTITSPTQIEGAETELASITQPEKQTIYTSTCEPIAEVSNDFADQLAIQGTGKLRDGRVLNVWGACKCESSPCYKVTQAAWGTAGNGRPLQPFRTVAVDPKLIKLGSLLYVPLLEGRQMPGRSPWGGYVHDGCLVADDTGGGIKGNQLDLFVGRKGWFLGMSGSGGSHAWARHVPVFDGSKICERKGRQVSRKSGAI
ncbi:MAG TPA: 3D domain-containing protein [Kofleriaceae bacterium]|nr:3D domain-containing protein [Kofleriaceae bacterium]